MKFTIHTKVKGNYLKVFQQFDQDLFEKLSPPGAQVELIRFDGSKAGDIVHIRLKMLGIISEDWISEIRESKVEEGKAWFIDQGTTLPFFLSFWHHRHLITADGPDQSVITDAIEFRTPFFLLDWLMFPVMYLQFLWRKPVYKRFFNA